MDGHAQPSTGSASLVQKRFLFLLSVNQEDGSQFSRWLRSSVPIPAQDLDDGVGQIDVCMYPIKALLPLTLIISKYTKAILYLHLYLLIQMYVVI